RAICKAAHSNRPISSKISEIRIIATKASVAFQTISATSTTSLKSTTPTIKAILAPPIADQPIFNPFGCQMTNTMVSKKIAIATHNIDDIPILLQSTADYPRPFLFQFLQLFVLTRQSFQDAFDKWIVFICFINRIKNPLSFSLFFNQTNITQFPQMLANSRLTHVENFHKFTDTAIMLIEYFHHR